MKLSTSNLLAILASTALIASAPIEFGKENVAGASLVKKSDITSALNIIEELGRLNQKRDQFDGELSVLDIGKRDNLLNELLSGLASSGIISNVWNIITKDEALKTEITSLVKSALQGAITAAPSLIKAVFNSGLIQKVFSDIWKNDQLKSALLSVAKTIFSSGLNLLKVFLSSKTTNVPTPTKRQNYTEDTALKVRWVSETNSHEFYDKRDLMDVSSAVVKAIYSSGIAQNLVNKALADPQASISFLTAALKNGVIVAKDLYSWAESSGLLKEGLNYIAKDGGTYSAEIAKFIGGLITSGAASVADIDNATTIDIGTTTTFTTVETTTSSLSK